MEEIGYTDSGCIRGRRSLTRRWRLQWQRQGQGLREGWGDTGSGSNGMDTRGTGGAQRDERGRGPLHREEERGRRGGAAAYRCPHLEHTSYRTGW